MADATATVYEPDQPDPLDIRYALAEAESSSLHQLAPLPPTLVERYTTIPLLSTEFAKAKLIHPASPSSTPRPLIVLFYGGGFSGGSCDQLTEPGRTFAAQFNAVVVLGSYRMIPEVRWPVPWEDGWNTLVYLSRHAHEPEWGSAELALERGGGFVVGGVSAGASIAAVCTGLDALGSAQGEGVEPLASRLTGLMANVPFLLVPEIVRQELLSDWTSWKDNEYSEGFNTNSLKAVMKAMKCTDYTSCWFSPIPELLRTQGRLEKHPRVYVSVCQLDPLRDDGRLYCELLKQKGVEVKLDLFREDGHAGWTVMPIPWKSKAPTIPEAYMDGMKWLLRR